MKTRDLIDYSLLRLGVDTRPAWQRSLGLRFGSGMPRRLTFYKKLDSIVAHPSASFIAAKTEDTLEFLAEQREAQRCMINT